MDPSRTSVRELNLEQTLSILQGWLGRSILLTIEPSVTSFPPEVIRGTLAAAHDILDTADSGRFGFTVGGGDFSIHPRQFADAYYYSDARHLEILVADSTSVPGSTQTLNVLLAGPHAR
jgi:hypothetical protein